MRKIVMSLAALAVAGSAWAGVARQHVASPALNLQAQRTELSARIIATFGQTAATEPTVIGSEFCLACHPTYAPWRDSLHAVMHADVPDDAGSMNPAEGIIFDSNKNGIDDFKDGLNFNTISTPFDIYKPNAPILSFVAGEQYPYRVTIGAITYKIFIKQGGFFQQRLITRIPVSDGAPDGLSKSWYMMPFAYSPVNHTYALYNAGKWWDSTATPKINPGMTAAQVAEIGRSWTKACIGCHATGYTVAKTATGEWATDPPPAALYRFGDRHYIDLDFDGNREFLGVGCESCHGGGSLHVLGGPDPAKIINPKNLTRDQQLWLCAQCHTRGKSVPAGDHDFAYKESDNQGYHIGDNVWDYYEDEGGRWPDGKTPSKGEQQYQAHEVSAHYTNPFHKVLCSECHDPHSGARSLPVTSVVSGTVTIPTAFENNTLCLSCHATHGPFADIQPADLADLEANRSKIGTVVSAHTNHPYGPERTMGLSRCTTCHMPKTEKRDYEYDETSHTMEAIPPQKTMLYQDKGGMPSSCMVSCHSKKVNSFGLGLDPVFKNWTETFDTASATILMRYYGPDGLWWKLDVSQPAPPVWNQSPGNDEER